MTNKKWVPLELAGSQGTHSKIISHNTTNNLEKQRAAILDYLRKHGTITTLQARKHLDILHPAGRIAELRRDGLEIDLVWCNDLSENGRPHRVGRYVLAGG